MIYPREFFHLIFTFADKVSQVTGRPIEESLLEYTNIYKVFSINEWQFSHENPIWKEFLTEFNESSDPETSMYNFYLRQPLEKNENIYFGCFRYEYIEEKNAIHMHFDSHGVKGVLAAEYAEERKAELRSMLTDIRKNYPDTKKLFGISWLYNIEAYTRLHPTEYIASAELFDNWFKSLALWGQFFDGSGLLRKKRHNNLLRVLRIKILLKN